MADKPDQQVLEPVTNLEERTGSQDNKPGPQKPDQLNSIDRWRTMRTHPTIALARAAALAPIKAQQWSYQIRSEQMGNLPPQVEDAQSFVRRVMSPLQKELLRQILYGVDYGFKPFEKVWMSDTDGKLIYKKIKPLSVKKTEVIIQEDGSFGGIKQKDIELEPQYCLWFTNDREDDNFFGASRMANVEYPWREWTSTARAMANYGALAAGPKPIIQYPRGEGRDASGQVKTNYELAKALVNDLMLGKGVYMPNDDRRILKDMLDRGVDISKVKAWMIEWLEVKGNHGGDFDTMLRYWDVAMMRGWLVPERTATEGQHGTKAEAGEHADVALMVAEELLGLILEHVNQYLVNPLLIYNYGPEYEDAVYVGTRPLVDEQQALLKKVLEKLLGSDRTTFQTWIDVDAALEQVGLPKVAEQLDEVTSDGEESNRNQDDPQTATSAEPEDGDASNGLQASLSRVYDELMEELN